MTPILKVGSQHISKVLSLQYVYPKTCIPLTPSGTKISRKGFMLHIKLKGVEQRASQRKFCLTRTFVPSHISVPLGWDRDQELTFSESGQVAYQYQLKNL